MILNIIDTTHGTVIDRAVEMGNVELYRPLTLGNNWTQLILGVHLDISAPDGNVSLGATGFGFGVSASQPYMASTTNHFVGVQVGANTTALLPVSNLFTWDNFDFVIKTGGTTTATNVPTANTFAGYAEGNGGRVGLFLYFKKGSPWTVSYLRPSVNTVTDLTTADFSATLEALDRANALNVLGSAYTEDATTAITPDEATKGDLVSCNVWWPSVSSSLRVNLVALAKWE